MMAYTSAGVISIAEIQKESEEIPYTDRSEKPRCLVSKPHYPSFANSRHTTISLNLSSKSTSADTKTRCIGELRSIYDHQQSIVTTIDVS